MKGMFQLRPATPRVYTTWQVGPVLRSLSSLEPLAELSESEANDPPGIDLSCQGS